MMRASATLLLAASGAGAQTVEPWDATLHLHHPETAAKFDAKCLDGAGAPRCAAIPAD
jgi:hypothetical protein